jgi:short-subunit dehydrogenase
MSEFLRTPPFSVHGDNVLITGASSGIGQHCATLLA